MECSHAAGQIPLLRAPLRGLWGLAIAAGVRSPSLTSGPIPCDVAFVEDRLPYAVNPRWGYARQKFRKVRFRFFVAGQALSFPQAGPWKVRPAGFGK